MAGRCGCASDQCACTIVAGPNVSVSGTGTRNNPYVVSAATTVVDEGGTPIPPGDAGRLPGEIVAYGGITAPEGWLLCDGTAVNRAVYSTLYAALGTRFGAGDGSTTFNLPDFTGRFPMGTNGANPVGTKAGANVKAISVGNLPSHTHKIDHDHAPFDTVSGGSHVHSFATTQSNTDGTSNSVKRDAAGTATAVAASGAHTHNINVPPYTGDSGPTGSGTPLDITPAMTAVSYIIKT